MLNFTPKFKINDRVAVIVKSKKMEGVINKIILGNCIDKSDLFFVKLDNCCESIDSVFKGEQLVLIKGEDNE